MRYTCSVAALTALLAAARRPAEAQQCGSGSLTLAQRAVETLPATFGIEGAVAGRQDSLVLWSAEGEVLELSAPGRLVRYKLPDGIHPVGMFVTPDGYRFLDRHSGREFNLGRDSVLREIGRIRVGDRELVDGAVWLHGSWTLAIRDAVGLDFRLRRGDDTLYHSARAANPKAIPRFHLSQAGDTLLLAEVGAPFQMLRVTPDGRVDTLASVLAAGLVPLAPAESLSRWRALPAVPIDCGVLVTLSDLTGDRRLLLRYALDGSLAKVTPLEAPLGLMTRVPGRESVLAARRVGTLELVWYDWRWIREPVGTN